MKRLVAACVVLVSACAAPPRPGGINPQIAGVIAKTADRAPEPRPEAVQTALLPPLRLDMPGAAAAPQDQRFDLSVTNAPASQVFLSIVSGTRYSMLVHPSVTGTLSVNLKNVTVEEALAAIRDLYGYEYRVTGSRIFIQPLGLQTRVFQVNYLPGQRRGMTDIRVTSGALTDTAASAGGAATASALTTTAGGAGAATRGRESTRVTTEQQATFWSDLCEALVAIAFPAESRANGAAAAASSQPEDRQRSICNRRHSDSDRSIVVSPHSGVIVVRSGPGELRAVEQYLRATRLAVERQVMLEAKIVEVTLSDEFQSGINWAIFGRDGGIGQVTRRSDRAPPNASVPSLPGGASTAAALVGATGAPGAVFGLALATTNFAALISFLESQGNVQVLSSPRIATLNNQKAVLKVGRDELFVSNVAVTPATTTGGAVTTGPTIAPQFAPYFSGIVLDVTPQIDENGNITLHIHPAISEITRQDINVNLGATAGGATTIPTARSQVSETDTIVRVTNGNIVAIGGLMKMDLQDTRGGLPGVLDEGIGRLFRSTERKLVKTELVILLKPTILDSDREWEQDLRDTRERLEAMGEAMRDPRSGPTRR